MAVPITFDVGTARAHVTAALMAGADAARRVGAPLALPTVHMFCADLDNPYVGYVRCRTFVPQPDAVAALDELGALPAAVAATHVVLVWDVARLRALLDPGHPARVEGLAVVEATFTEHVAHLLPLGERVGEWGATRSWPGGRLPAPIAAALQRWRGLGDDDVAGTSDALERAGYRVRWAGRPDQAAG